jgi:hypothetical protein
MFLRFITLWSARISALVKVLSGRLRECRKRGDLSDFETGKVIGACLVYACVIETATLRGIFRATVSEVMPGYRSHGKTIQRRGRMGENQNWKEEIDRRTRRRILLKTSAAQVTTYLYILEYWTICFHKLSAVAITKLLTLITVILRYMNDGVTAIRPAQHKKEACETAGRTVQPSLEQLSEIHRLPWPEQSPHMIITEPLHSVYETGVRKRFLPPTPLEKV